MRLCILKTVPSPDCTIMQRYILEKALIRVLYRFQSTLNLGPVTLFCCLWNRRQNANFQRRKCSHLLKFWNILIIDNYIFTSIFHFCVFSDIYLTLFFAIKSLFMWPSWKTTQAKMYLQQNDLKPLKILWGVFFPTHLNYSFAKNVSNLEWIFMDKLYENGGFK